MRLKEQEELDLAIALSLTEAEQPKTKTTTAAASEFQSSNTNERSSQEDAHAPQLPTLNSDQDSDLQKYLDRSYWEQRNKTSDNDSLPQSEPPAVQNIVQENDSSGVGEKSEVVTIHSIA